MTCMANGATQESLMSELIPYQPPGPMRVGALVPRYVRYQLERVQVRGLITQEQLLALDEAITVASDSVARLALLHEAMIKVAPLADEGLAELRQVHVALARQIIERGI